MKCPVCDTNLALDAKRMYCTHLDKEIGIERLHIVPRDTYICHNKRCPITKGKYIDIEGSIHTIHISIEEQISILRNIHSTNNAYNVQVAELILYLEDQME